MCEARHDIITKNIALWIYFNYEKLMTSIKMMDLFQTDAALLIY